MKSGILYATLASAFLATAGYAADQPDKPGVVMEKTTTVTAVVQKVDKKTREVTLKGTDGNIVTVVAGEDVKNFDQIKKGDHVNAEYQQSLALYVRKTNEPATAEESSSLQTANKGDKPAMNAGRMVKITAKVENIDYDTRMITLRGPKGGAQTFRVSDDVKRFNEVKKGDEVVAHYSEALAVAITTPEKK